MPTLLCVWEQGGQRGHLAHLRLPIERALAAGYRVIVAARELQHLPQLLGDLPLHWLPAPHKPDVQPADQSAFLSYTHILQRQCFASEDELIAQLVAWDTLLQLVKPDGVLFEHSPTALIAAWGRPFRKILIGNGFSLPPPASAGQPLAPFPTTPRTAQVQAELLA
ncbi:MAG: hypothetical protein FGM55_16680, partial [Rhodoferax sp.]|nr:hypothetical protein [Rhodoferax sp.]